MNNEVVAFTKNTDRDHILNLLKTVGIIVLRDHGMSLDEYHNWQYDLGYHLPPDVWCSHKDYPLFWRVTNDKVDDHHEGLFGHSDIEWHSNILFTYDNQEIVSLWGHKIPETDCSPTTYSNSIPYFKNLDPVKKERYKKLYTKFHWKVENAFYKVPFNVQNASLNLEMPMEQMKALSRKTWIGNSVNITDDDKKLYQPARYNFEGRYKLVPNHPLGSEGLFFPLTHITDFVDEDNHSQSDAREIFKELKSDWLDCKDYMYTHEWQKDDIVIADQLTGLHRRDFGIPDTVVRELLRSTCWYKTKDRIHYGYSL